MTTFIDTFKAKAKNKNLTASDIIALCIYKTVKAKSEDKATILKHFLKKSFSAGRVCSHRPYAYAAITNNMYYFSRELKAGKKWSIDGWFETQGRALNKEITELLSEEEAALFRQVTEMIYPEFVKAL